jgi:hypothetical protein
VRSFSAMLSKSCLENVEPGFEGVSTAVEETTYPRPPIPFWFREPSPPVHAGAARQYASQIKAPAMQSQVQFWQRKTQVQCVELIFE